MKSIVVPVDGSEAANHAARFSVQIAQANHATLLLLHVYDAPSAAVLGLGALSAEQMEELKVNLAKGSFDGAKKAMGNVNLPVEEHVVFGHPGTEIVTFAEEKKADIVIMGCRGRSPVASLIGSVSEYVVRHASCPVTIVR